MGHARSSRFGFPLLSCAAAVLLLPTSHAMAAGSPPSPGEPSAPPPPPPLVTEEPGGGADWGAWLLGPVLGAADGAWYDAGHEGRDVLPEPGEPGERGDGAVGIELSPPDVSPPVAAPAPEPVPDRRHEPYPAGDAARELTRPGMGVPPGPKAQGEGADGGAAPVQGWSPAPVAPERGGTVAVAEPERLPERELDGGRAATAGTASGGPLVPVLPLGAGMASLGLGVAFLALRLRRG